jgi:hypothetical protein
MNYQLICEGACNPTLKAIDALAERVVHDRRKDRIVASDYDAMVRGQRALTYTEHRYINDQNAVCEVCGSHRGFGGLPAQKAQS